MNNITKQLFEVVIKTIPSFEKIESYDREHVFFDIIKFSAKDSTEENTFSMYFIFNKYQKILSLLRKNNFVLAEHHLKYLNKNEIIFSNNLSKIGMESLYFPVIAYYYYKKGAYDLALKNLNSAYLNIDELYANGFIDAPFSVVEQKINEFRIVLEKSEIDRAMNLALLLITNILNRNAFLHFNKPFSTLCNSEGELVSFVNYILDKVMIKSSVFDKKSLITKEHIINFLISIKAFISENEIEHYYKQLHQSLSTIIFLFNNEDEKCFELLLNEPTLILNNKLASTTAYLLYKAMIDYIKIWNYNKFKEVVELFEKNINIDGYKYFMGKILQDIDMKAEVINEI